MCVYDYQFQLFSGRRRRLRCRNVCACVCARAFTTHDSHQAFIHHKTRKITIQLFGANRPTLRARAHGRPAPRAPRAGTSLDGKSCVNTSVLLSFKWRCARRVVLLDSMTRSGCALAQRHCRLESCWGVWFVWGAYVMRSYVVVFSVGMSLTFFPIQPWAQSATGARTCAHFVRACAHTHNSRHSSNPHLIFPSDSHLIDFGKCTDAHTHTQHERARHRWRRGRFIPGA